MHLPCNQERCPIHPLLQGADTYSNNPDSPVYDSSPLARGRRSIIRDVTALGRFIPSCEGQTFIELRQNPMFEIHPLLRGADIYLATILSDIGDSSPLVRGRHSMFMRLSAVSNTSLCNLHKCCSFLIHIFNMPKNLPHFQFLNVFCFSIPITRDIPAPYDLDRPTPFLIRFRNAFASLTRSRNSYPNTLTG